MAKQLLQADPETIDKGVVSVEQQLRIERFLALEAELMDEHEYDRWMALWSDGDIRYWVPCNSDEQDPSTGIAIIYDDRAHLDERMMRLKDKAAHAYRPRARLVRVVGGIVPIAVDGDEIQVISSFTLGEIRTGIQNIWLGKCHYHLMDSPGGLRIRRKKVMLLNNDEAMPNLTFLV